MDTDIRYKKAIRFMKDKLGGKISTEFMLLRPKTYSYLIDDGGGDRKAKETKESERKQRLKFEDYTKCIQNTKQYQDHNKVLKAKRLLFLIT